MKLKAGSDGGFTFVEILVTIGVSAGIIASAAIAFHAVGTNAKRFSTLAQVDIGTNAANDFGITTGIVTASTAPNYGKLALALDLKSRLLEDIQSAAAVYCLDRRVPNTIRPSQLAFPYVGAEDIRPTLDTPERFRAFLNAVEPTASGVFQHCRNIPSGNRASVFVLGASAAPDVIPVIAVYDLDLIAPGNRGGVYASVKRYVDGNLTHFYDALFQGAGGEPFAPLFVNFERSARLSLAEGDIADSFKAAPGSPFTLMWWPDPSFDFLSSRPHAGTYGARDPRGRYAAQAGRTALVLVIPMFPSL